jgi:hypothetical protein
MIVLVPLLLVYCRRRQRRINVAVIVGVRHRFLEAR